MQTITAMPPLNASPTSDGNNVLPSDAIFNHVPASLGTFLARIQFDNGYCSPLLCGFCDTGAQVNLITESCVQVMQLKRR